MKVFIGKYKNWFGPYQFSDMLKYVGASEEICENFGDYLSSKKRIKNIFQWIDSKKTRKILIKVDKYDTWNLDRTLAIVILPLLKEFRKDIHSYPCSLGNDLSFIPDDSNDRGLKTWEETIDKMIWSFEQLNKDDFEDEFYIQHGEIGDTFLKDGKINWKTEPIIDEEGRKKYNAKIQEGLELFSKYFRELWN